MGQVADLIAALGKTIDTLTPDERIAIDTIYWTAYLAAHPAPAPAPPPPTLTPLELKRQNTRKAVAQAKADRIFRSTWADPNWRPTAAETTEDEQHQRSRKKGK